MYKTTTILAVVFLSVASAQEKVDFFNSPDGVVTNISCYPISFGTAGPAEISVDREPKQFCPLGGSFFMAYDLEVGENRIHVVRQDDEGVLSVIKTVIYDPDYLTTGEMVYGNMFYPDPNLATSDAEDYYCIQKELYCFGCLVIDPNEGSFKGFLKDQWVKAVTNDGLEFITTYGRRFSTLNHLPTWVNIPDYDYGQRILVSDEFAYYGNNKLDLAKNKIVQKLPFTITDSSSITPDGQTILDSTGRYVVPTDTFIKVSYTAGSKPYGRHVAAVPNRSVVLTSSYGPWGEFCILNYEDGHLLAKATAGDYSGDIVFSPDGQFGYCGFFGNTYYGYGEIRVVDLRTVRDEIYSMHGPRSLAISPDGKLYASAFLSLRSGVWIGDRNIRGVVELVQNDTLEIVRVFYVNLEGSIDEPYYGPNCIFVKPSIVD